MLDPAEEAAFMPQNLVSCRNTSHRGPGQYRVGRAAGRLPPRLSRPLSSSSTVQSTIGGDLNYPDHAQQTANRIIPKGALIVTQHPSKPLDDRAPPVSFTTDNGLPRNAAVGSPRNDRVVRRGPAARHAVRKGTRQSGRHPAPPAAPRRALNCQPDRRYKNSHPSLV